MIQLTKGLMIWELRTSTWFPTFLQVGCSLGLMVMTSKELGTHWPTLHGLYHKALGLDHSL
jgi:hypothetical protein